MTKRSAAESRALQSAALKQWWDENRDEIRARQLAGRGLDWVCPREHRPLYVKLRQRNGYTREEARAEIERLTA